KYGGHRGPPHFPDVGDQQQQQQQQQQHNSNSSSSMLLGCTVDHQCYLLTSPKEELSYYWRVSTSACRPLTLLVVPVVMTVDAERVRSEELGWARRDRGLGRLSKGGMTAVA
ncbi:unnamed protein product, partial [Ectocarpus sp. 8 AP-2014]